jgi:hypothetical protein
MNCKTPIAGMSPIARTSGVIVAGAVTLALRAVALLAFVLMSLAEPFLAAIFGVLALGCFFDAVLFGFILHMPFQHRWDVLGASVLFVMAYLLFRAIMRGVQRLLP